MNKSYQMITGKILSFRRTEYTNNTKPSNRYDTMYSDFIKSIKKRKIKGKVRNSYDQQLGSMSKINSNKLLIKPSTHSFATRRKAFESMKRTYTAITGQRHSKVYVGDNPFVYFCDKYTKNATHKVFSSTLPRMLEARFERLIEFSKSTDKTILPTSSISQLMKNEGFGETLAERVVSLIDNKYKVFDQGKFAELLLNVLVDKSKMLRFCFDVLRVTEKEFLDYVGLAAWFQSDAEGLLRNDLLSISKLLKAYTITGWNNSRILRKDGKNEENQRKSKQHLSWDLGLWGSACKKSIRLSHGRNLISYRTRIHHKEDILVPTTLYGNYINVPKDDKVTFEQFKQIEFGNKGLPDLLFLVIQLIYGVEVCDSYCNHIAIKLFRPFNRKQENELVLKRIYKLPASTLINFQYIKS